MEEIEGAIRRAACHLVATQDSDGFWRDYALAPGSSSSWVTACVAYALFDENHANATAEALALAARSVQRVCRPAGWGYNEAVAADADTTAWVVRWFQRIGVPLPIDVVSCLQGYLSPGGGARTYRDRSRYGRWTIEHADVTPIVGLALAEASADPSIISRVRGWILEARNPDGVWDSFWWSSNAYATARCVEFLSRTGGVTEAVLGDVRRFLQTCTGPDSAIEAAHVLIACVFATGIDAAARPARLLLDRQLDCGGWRPSRVLRVPEQRSDVGDSGVFEDARGLMSTAMVVMALRIYTTAFLVNDEPSIPHLLAEQ